MHYVNRHLGESAIVVGCGPSVFQFDYDWWKEQAETKLIVAAHGVPAYIPYRYMISLHTHAYWLRVESQDQLLREHKYFKDMLTGDFHMVKLLRAEDEEVIPMRDGRINHFWTTGAAALSLAYQLGANHIEMIGLDLRADSTGRIHVNPTVLPDAKPYQKYHNGEDTVLGFQKMIDKHRQAGVTIKNLSECSLLS